MLGYADARRLGGRYAGRTDLIPLRWRTRRIFGRQAGQLDGGQVSRDCLYRCSTRTGTSRTTWQATIPGRKSAPFAVPKPKHSSPVCCAHVKRPTRVQPPALQPTNASFTPGRGTTFLKNSRDRYRRHAARIDVVSVTSTVTFTRTSTDTRVGAI